MDYTNRSLGLRVQTQIPLNVKKYIQNENSLKNLGLGDNLAFVYEKGLIVYCIDEGTRYEWKEIEDGDVGLLDDDFTYPDNIITFGIDYSNKIYNFVKVEFGSGELPPLELLDNGNGNGIVIRDRIDDDYGNIGFRAVDLSYSTYDPEEFDEKPGATGLRSFASGYNTLASGINSHAEGNGCIARAANSHAEGSNTETDGLNSAAHAEGSGTYTFGFAAHAEGINTEAISDGAHSEGSNTIASAQYSHSEGRDTIASGVASHAEGKSTESVGQYSHSGGVGNISQSLAETSIGSYSTLYSGSALTFESLDRIFNIGNGVDDSNLSDALTILKNGLATLPSINNTLIEAASGKVIVTKEYLESLENKQKIITYPGSFTGTNYTLMSSDYNTLIFIDNGSTNVTITVPTGLPDKFFSAFIQQGTGTVTFTASGTTINTPTGLEIEGQNYQAALDKIGSGTIFHLTGNIKA